MTEQHTWIADDLSNPTRTRRRVRWLVALVAALAVAATLFLATGPPRPTPPLRDPGTFGRLTAVDLLPGYELDRERRLLGPARASLDGGTSVFLPTRTPWTGATPCAALRSPEGGDDAACHVFVWLEDDGRTVSWLTNARPGGPGEVLLDGRLLGSSRERLVLDEGTSVVPSADLRLAECGQATLATLSGARVVISIDTATGQARQVTCRA